METPVLKQTLSRKKKPPVDAELRELRGVAVKLEKPANNYDSVHKMSDAIDGKVEFTPMKTPAD